MDTFSTAPYPYLEEELAICEERRHLKPDEKLAVYRWLKGGHSLREAPPSRYLCHCHMPEGWDFLDVYRLDKEIDTDTRGMRAQEKADYLWKYFGYTISDDEELPWEDEGAVVPSGSTTSGDMVKINRKLYWIWEFVVGEGLAEEAREYLEKHMEKPAPFDL